MTMIEIKLPDEVARRARSAGLLSDSAIAQLLEDAMRRRAGRALIDAARSIQDAGIPPMSMEEIDVEVKAVRTQRRADETVRTAGQGGTQGDDAGRP